MFTIFAASTDYNNQNPIQEDLGSDNQNYDTPTSAAEQNTLPNNNLNQEQNTSSNPITSTAEDENSSSEEDMDKISWKSVLLRVFLVCLGIGALFYFTKGLFKPKDDVILKDLPRNLQNEMKKKENKQSLELLREIYEKEQSWLPEINKQYSQDSTRTLAETQEIQKETNECLTKINKLLSQPNLSSEIRKLFVLQKCRFTDYVQGTEKLKSLKGWITNGNISFCLSWIAFYSGLNLNLEDRALIINQTYSQNEIDAIWSFFDENLDLSNQQEFLVFCKNKYDKEWKFRQPEATSQN